MTVVGAGSHRFLFGESFSGSDPGVRHIVRQDVRRGCRSVTSEYHRCQGIRASRTHRETWGQGVGRTFGRHLIEGLFIQDLPPRKMPSVHVEKRNGHRDTPTNFHGPERRTSTRLGQGYQQHGTSMAYFCAIKLQAQATHKAPAQGEVRDDGAGSRDPTSIDICSVHGVPVEVIRHGRQQASGYTSFWKGDGSGAARRCLCR